VPFGRFSHYIEGDDPIEFEDVRVRTSFRCSKHNILPQQAVLHGPTGYSKLQQLNIRIIHFRLSLAHSPYCTISNRFINDNLLYLILRERA